MTHHTNECAAHSTNELTTESSLIRSDLSEKNKQIPQGDIQPFNGKEPVDGQETAVPNVKLAVLEGCKPNLQGTEPRNYKSRNRNELPVCDLFTRYSPGLSVPYNEMQNKGSSNLKQIASRDDVFRLINRDALDYANILRPTDTKRSNRNKRLPKLKKKRVAPQK